MRTTITRSFTRCLWGTALALVVATACGYSPDPESGTLKCGPSNTCPEGFSCRSGLCWKDGAGGSGGGGTSGRGGSGGGGGSGSVAKFVGTWTFVGAASKRVRQCNDGTNETIIPWDDYFAVAAGPVAALSADYYCTWNLDVNGNATVIRTGTSCTKPDPNMPGTSYTWHGETFNLQVAADGLTGTLDASLPYDYVTSSGSGSCTMKFTGQLTKTP